MKEQKLFVSLMLFCFAFALGLPQAAAAESERTTSALAAEAAPPNGGPGQIKPIQPAPESLEEDIPDWRARLELARLLSYAGRYEESLAEYGWALQEKPDLWEAKTEMARVLFWSGRQSEAAKILEALPPERVDESAKLLMADLYVALKAFNKAEPIYRARFKAHPDDYEVGVKLADLLSWTKRYEEAVVFYKAVLSARPDDIQLRRKYAYVLMWAGKQSEAAAELKKTLKK